MWTPCSIIKPPKYRWKCIYSSARYFPYDIRQEMSLPVNVLTKALTKFLNEIAPRAAVRFVTNWAYAISLMLIFGKALDLLFEQDRILSLLF